jgi:hypothetical protein
MGRDILEQENYRNQQPQPVDAALPATAIPQPVAPAVDTRPPVSFNNESLAGYPSTPTATPKNMASTDVVNDILSRVAASTQAPNYVTQADMGATRGMLTNDMSGYRQAMDTQTAIRPSLSPKMAAEMAMANRADANPILRANSAAEVAMHNDRMATWDAQNKAIADKYGMLGKMQGQLAGQESGALTQEMLGRQQNNAANLSVAQDGMKLQALPTEIEARKASTEATRAGARRSDAETAKTNAETEEIKSYGGKRRMEEQKQFNGLEAQRNKMVSERASLLVKSANTTGSDKEAVDAAIKKLDSDIEGHEQSMMGIYPELATKAGIKTPEQRTAEQVRTNIQSYMADAEKKRKQNSTLPYMFGSGNANQDDPQHMSDRLRAAGYSDADLKLHMGDKYKPAQGQQQQAIPADKAEKSAMPEAKGNEGRIIKDTETGKRMVSRGGKWEEIK